MRYLVQERIFSIKADFWIEDSDGNRVFVVDGKALSLRETFELKDAYGNLLIVIRKKFFSMRDTMEIENGSGVIATVRPAFFSPIKHRYEIDLAGGARLEAVGSFADKDWELKDGHHVVGRISRRWFRVELQAERLDWLPPLLASLDRPFAVERPAELRDLIAALADRLATSAWRDPPDEQPEG